MDQICQNEDDNSGFQKYVEDQFDMFVHDFEEFQKTSLLPHPHPHPHPINPSSGHLGPPQSTTQQDFITTLQQRSEEFEYPIFPPNQMNMNNNMNTTGNFEREGHDHYYSTQYREETKACVGTGGTVVGSFTTRYANITTAYACSSSGNSGGGTLMDSILKLANLSTCRVHNRGGVKMGSFAKHGFSVLGAKAKTKAPPRRTKRKYRGVYETEAQFILRIERQKIKNRETAARSFENKQANEAHLLAQVQKLRQTNEFLKKLLAFLEYTRINLPKKLLKRTISGPI